LVTFNLKDFDIAFASARGVLIIHPDEFLERLINKNSSLTHKPKSVYELAKLVNMDVSNLNKLIVFFETIGAISIKTSIVSGRTVKTPVVEYGHIEFDLKAA